MPWNLDGISNAQGGSGATFINPDDAFSGDQGASTLLGKLYRAQWQDWKDRFSPYIDKLANKASDPGFLNEQSTQAAASVRSTYDNVQAGMETQRQGYGLNQTAAQQGSEQRKMALGRSADSNAAYNNARISARDLQDQVLAGGMGLNNIPQAGQGQ